MNSVRNWNKRPNQHLQSWYLSFQYHCCMCYDDLSVYIVLAKYIKWINSKLKHVHKLYKKLL